MRYWFQDNSLTTLTPSALKSIEKQMPFLRPNYGRKPVLFSRTALQEELVARLRGLRATGVIVDSTTCCAVIRAVIQVGCLLHAAGCLC